MRSIVLTRSSGQLNFLLSRVLFSPLEKVKNKPVKYYNDWDTKSKIKQLKTHLLENEHQTILRTHRTSCYQELWKIQNLISLQEFRPLWQSDNRSPLQSLQSLSLDLGEDCSTKTSAQSVFYML